MPRRNHHHKRPVGKPPLSDDSPTVRATVRLTADELEAAHAMAADAGVSLSEFVRALIRRKLQRRARQAAASPKKKVAPGVGRGQDTP